VATMTWFWRLVCEPECSEACQTDCPGCRALADEWESQGHVLPVTGPPPAKFRWSKLPVMWRCFSRSATARVVARLVPGRRRSSGGPAVAAAGQPCCTPATPATLAPHADGLTLSQSCCAPVPGEDELALKEQMLGHCSAVASAVLASSADGCCAGPAVSADGTPRASSLAVNLDESLVYSGIARSGLAVAAHSPTELANVPAEAVLAALGCGTPLTRAQLRPGDVVLDLGSGGGIDAVAAAGRVGPDGKVIGLDASDEMLELARANAAKSGAANAEFVKGELEEVPLPEGSVDVIISNCVLPVVPDKRRALGEAYRVLRPGGRLALSDIVTRYPVPDVLKSNKTAWLWCLGGALSEDEYREHLVAVGFTDVVISRNRVYTIQDAEAAGLLPVIRQAGLEMVLEVGFSSSSILARKPAAA
jgi:arsenite methyltransferase